MKIDLADGDSVRQLAVEAQLVRALEPPAGDLRIFPGWIWEPRFEVAHHHQRVAPDSCRSHVETRPHLQERPHELSTGRLWEAHSRWMEVVDPNDLSQSAGGPVPVAFPTRADRLASESVVELSAPSEITPIRDQRCAGSSRMLSSAVSSAGSRAVMPSWMSTGGGA